MAFALLAGARLLLDLLSQGHDDVAGFASCCGPASCFTPLRTPPLSDARRLPYRGPWRLPGPDSHRLAALNLPIGYITTTSLLPSRPIVWAHARTV